MVLVCDLIRGRREGLGLTQVDLAELIGVSRNSIGRWESGRGTGKRNEGGPTAPNRKKLAFVLGGEPSDYECRRLTVRTRIT